MQTIWQDARYGARMLMRNPGFTLVAVITLALGMGANSAVFSVANALLLNPLPFENLDRLAALREALPNQGLKATAVSAADFKDWREQTTAFQNIAAYRVRDVALTGANEPELVRGAFVSAEFFAALDISPDRGRALLADEDQPGRNQVAVLGYALWQRRFAGDPGILGASVTLDDRAVTIVGIMPESFDFPFGSELWMPLALTPQQMNQRGVRNLQVLAHLNPGVTRAEAQAEMTSVAKRLEQQYPQTNANVSAQVIPLANLEGDFTRPLIAVLIAMAGFLLLIACSNVANLLFARATARRKEMAIRASLGASRWQIVRQLMTEGLLLSLVAAAAGLVLALWSVDVIKASLPPDIARFMMGWKEIAIDSRALVFTLAVAFVTAILFSLAPALQASRSDLNETLKEGGRSSGARTRARSFLVAAEMTLALVLLVGAGLMVKGSWRILDIFEGADAESILTMQTPLSESKYKDPRKISEFYAQAVERLKSMPEAREVSLASNTPLNNSPNPNVELIIEGRPPLAPGERQSADLIVISSGYFTTVGAPLLAGRDFKESDEREANPVAIISEMTSRRYFRDEDPVGRRIRRAGSSADDRWITIVGVVSDLRQAWFDREMRPALYLPYQQSPRLKMTFLLRTADPMNLAAAARSQIHSIDRDQPVDDMKTLARLFVDEMSPFRFAASLMLVLGAIALMMSAVGVYSVMSYSVAQRAHEMGIRIALGAQSRDVLRLVVEQAVRTALAGLGVGLLLAFGLSRVMASMLFGVVSLEYSVVIGFALLLVAAAFLSSYLPARRAARVDPIVALRCE
ncbi:MAG: ABC transporter permease [Acidobacteriota bacterium]